VLSPASVDGVCGGSHARGNCTIALRLTRGYRKSGDDREWRWELSSNLPPASRHPRLILTSKMTPLSAVWLCPWRSLRACPDSVGVHSACTTAWRKWYKRREWTDRQLCCRRSALGGAECHRRIDGIGRHGTRWRQRLACNTRRTPAAWGTPTSKVVSEDRCCPRFANCIRSCRYDRIQDSAVPDTPNSVCSRFVSVEWHTVSKAAERSRQISFANGIHSLKDDLSDSRGERWHHLSYVTHTATLRVRHSYHTLAQ